MNEWMNEAINSLYHAECTVSILLDAFEWHTTRLSLLRASGVRTEIKPASMSNGCLLIKMLSRLPLFMGGI